MCSYLQLLACTGPATDEGQVPFTVNRTEERADVYDLYNTQTEHAVA